MRALTALLLIVAAAPVFAQDVVYVGLGLGRLDYSEDMTDPELGDIADTTTSEKVYGGFEFNEHFAIEVSYGKTGNIRAQATAFDISVGNYDVTLKTDFTMTSLIALGQVPRDWGAIIGGLGYFSSSNDFRVQRVAQCCSQTSTGTIRDDGLAAKIGIEWRFGRFGTRYGVRLEYDWYDIADRSTSTLGLGFSYGF